MLTDVHCKAVSAGCLDVASLAASVNVIDGLGSTTIVDNANRAMSKNQKIFSDMKRVVQVLVHTNNDENVDSYQFGN